MRMMRLLLIAVLLVPGNAAAAAQKAPPRVQGSASIPVSSSQLAKPPSGAAAPPAAKASLTGVSEAIAAEQPGPAAAAPSAAATTFFDAASPKAYAAAGAVAAVGLATGGAGLPAAYALVRAGADPKTPKNEPVPRLKDRALQNLEASVALPPVMFFAHFADQLITGGGQASAVLTAGFMALAAAGMEQTVATARRRVVGGWQASHDQKFRVDPQTGELKDVRGTNKEYGKDRYEVYHYGHVGPLERLYHRLAPFGAGAFMLSGSSETRMLVFASALTGFYVLHDWLRSRVKPAYVPSADDLAHARRFNKD